MTDFPENQNDDHRMEKLREQWEKEWGPEISPWKRRVSALFIVAAFAALLVAVILTVT